MKKLHAMIPLLVVGLLAAGIWRLEVELHGWAGLTWTGYFHWAVPGGILFFTVWLNYNIEMGSFKKRMVYLCAGFIFLLFYYYLAKWSIIHIYGTRYFLPFMEWDWWQRVGFFSIVIVFPAFPILFWIMARLFFGLPLRIRYACIGYILYWLAFPAAMALLLLVQHRGGRDILHAIKSGFVIPFIVLALGLPFAILENKN